MRYVIYGAGAVGGTLGARLFEAGREVVLIARGAHGRTLAADGLTFTTPERTRRLAIPAVAHPRDVAFRPGDVVFLTVKGQDTDEALRALADAAPAELPVVCAQNGVENERRALRMFANVYAMVVMMPSIHLEPGTVTCHGMPRSGILDLGRYPTGTDATAATIACDLDGARLYSQAVPDPMTRKYAKLLVNLGNAVEAACGPGLRGTPLEERAHAEGVACLEAAGIAYRVGRTPEDGRREPIRSEPIAGQTRGGGSTWQSVARGTGSVEADYLNGEIVLLGRRHGIATPVNAYLQRLARRMARERIPAGSLPLAELERELAATA